MSCGVVWVGNGGKFICTLVYGVDARLTCLVGIYYCLCCVVWCCASEGGCFGGGGGNVGLHGDLCVRYGTEY